MVKNNFPNQLPLPFALSLSKGRSWLDKVLLSVVEELSSRIRGATPTNGEVIYDLILRVLR